MAVSPILPNSWSDPTGLAGLIRSAERDFDRKIKQIARYYKDQLESLNYTVITVNSLEVNETRYQFLLDQFTLQDMFRNADRYVDEIMLSGGEQNWFFNAYVSTGYQRGTAKVFSNLAAQSPVYKAGQGSLREILLSAPYQNRIALVRARAFEEMKALSGKVKADMSRVLADGIGRGLNPRDIAKNLTETTGIDQRRAHLVARTEITNALRTARLEEADYAAEAYGIRSMQMHLAAFKNTSRPNHLARHGKLYTRSEVRDFYSTAKEVCNCLCATVEVMVDENNKPLVPSIVERAKKTKEVAEARLAQESN